jgi:hypothetical protein
MESRRNLEVVYENLRNIEQTFEGQHRVFEKLTIDFAEIEVLLVEVDSFSLKHGWHSAYLTMNTEYVFSNNS